MKLRLRKPPISIKANELQSVDHRGFNINHLETENFNILQ
jgi:hypothetical protein